MRLSKIGYCADFYVYPCLLVLLSVSALRNASIVAQMDWALAFLAGTAAWSLVEYLAHRFILHRVPPFRQLHALHHAAPTALVGTPTWLSVAIMAAGVFVPLWCEAGLNLASGFTAGLVLGYLWYVSVHYAIHHWRVRQGSYLYRAKLRHALHHRAGPSCNFGVTTQWWDLAFGSTRVPTAPSAIARSGLPSQ